MQIKSTPCTVQELTSQKFERGKKIAALAAWSSGIVSAFEAMGREIESRRGIGG
jgi:hypothetical protein